MDKEQALRLKPGEVLHYTGPSYGTNAPEWRCGGPRSNRWKVNGQPVTYKRPENEHRWRVPVKFGLRDYDEVNESNVEHFHREDDCPLNEMSNDSTDN